jgi:hypothetical protein
MARHPRRFLLAIAIAVVVVAVPVLLAGCDRGPHSTTSVDATSLGLAGTKGGLRGRPQEGHAWFPLTPGRYADFRIRRYPVEQPTFVRATFGEPELFFGRLATPWVFGEVPGLPVDTTLYGLRQYYSIAPDGSLWFHGAHNRGFMSHTEPPVRMLPPKIELGAAITDTVFFESFLPGNIPFFSATQSFRWTIDRIEWLDLPAGSYRAARASLFVDDVEDGAGVANAGLVEAAFFGARVSAGEEAIVARARREDLARGPGEGDLVPERGMWFARHTGMVARDYPHGPGPEVTNITTYERWGEGFGPVPEPSPAP